MTYEEAIKIFRRQLEIANKNVADFEKTFKNQKSNYRYDVELYELAISALEKQIPKKPINIRGAYFGKGKGGDCPNCRVGVNSIEYKYCRTCGQVLDWSDTE